MSDLTAHQGLRGLTLAVISEWTSIFTLIFGGCCSNALTLEQLTRAHPHSGSLITFAQFLSIALRGLPKFLTVPRREERRGLLRWLPIPRFRKRRVPLVPYLVQVALFYAISLLNNKAFGYQIPMPVHIIFRSGGLVVSMVMGWAFAGKRYNKTQVASVLLVTAGVVLTTLSASKPKTGTSFSTESAAGPTSQYATGIAILSLALVFGGALGLVQDWTYGRYAHSPPPAAVSASNGTVNGHRANGAVKKSFANGKVTTPGPDSARRKLTREDKNEDKDKVAAADDEIQPWQESMFYLHFLSLPLFFFVREDLATQIRAMHSSPLIPLSSFFVLPLPQSLRRPSHSFAPILHPPFGLELPLDFFNFLSDLAVPSAYVPLTLTTLTAMVCVTGVNRLTARVSSLTVTLVLVLRKALSMVVSVVLFRRARGEGEIDARMMWAGAGLVFLGTVGYAAGSRGKGMGREKVKVKKE